MQTELDKQSRVVAIVVLSFILCMVSSPAYALYIKYEGTAVSWSSTKLGGGPFQPYGWVQVRDVAPGFTGEIFAPDFLAASSLVTYGTYETVTWGREQLHPLSKVTFTAGVVTDINLVFVDPVRARLLAVSGPPTANAVLVNTPEPPCMRWPGFDDLEFCGARVAVQITTTTAEPPATVRVTVPPIPQPTYPARADVNINGALQFNAQGGLLFGSPYTRLNAFGPYLLTGTLDWTISNVSESNQLTKRIWFTKVLLHHQATGQMPNGIPTNFGADDDYWVLGEPLSWLEMKLYTVENVSEFCAELVGIGICDLRLNFSLTSGSVAFGMFDRTSPASLSEVGANFLVDLSQIGGLGQLTSTFSGSLTHKAVTVPVLEAR